jgi:hypothetical protein
MKTHHPGDDGHGHFGYPEAALSGAHVLMDFAGMSSREYLTAKQP